MRADLASLNNCAVPFLMRADLTSLNNCAVPFLMRADLASLNNCAVPFLSRVAAPTYARTTLCQNLDDMSIRIQQNV